MSTRAEPAAQLARTREAFRIALEALQVPPEHRVALTAAAEAVAKARAIVAVREFVVARTIALGE